MNRFGLTAVLLFTLLSCSVKEDRSLCACRLTVDLSSCTGAGDLIRIRVLTADEIIERDFIPGEDSPYYEIPVSKGSCSLEAFLCPQGLQAGSGGISVAPGESCPELYAFCSSFQAAGETAGQKVELHKQFSQITLVLEDSPWDNPGCVFEETAPSAGPGPVFGTWTAALPPAQAKDRRFGKNTAGTYSPGRLPPDNRTGPYAPGGRFRLGCTRPVGRNPEHTRRGSVPGNYRRGLGNTQYKPG